MFSTGFLRNLKGFYFWMFLNKASPVDYEGFPQCREARFVLRNGAGEGRSSASPPTPGPGGFFWLLVCGGRGHCWATKATLNGIENCSLLRLTWSLRLAELIGLMGGKGEV